MLIWLGVCRLGAGPAPSDDAFLLATLLITKALTRDWCMLTDYFHVDNRRGSDSMAYSSCCFLLLVVLEDTELDRYI